MLGLKTDLELGLTTKTPEEMDMYDAYRERMFGYRANGMYDRVCSFKEWKDREEKQANLFDELMAERENV